MNTEEQLLQDRLARRQAIADLGFDPYGHRFDGAMSIDSIRRRYDPAAKEPVVRAAGRVISKNDRGKLVFFHIKDSTGSIQVMASKGMIHHPGECDPCGTVSLDMPGEMDWKLIQNLQVGDIVGVEGFLTATNTGEISIKIFNGTMCIKKPNHPESLTTVVAEGTAKAITFLAKSLATPPDKFHGLTDVETLHRHRHLELLYRDGAVKTLQRRSEMVWKIRQCLHKHGFTEVETPVLQPIAGGAAARPFKTHHNAYDMDLFLRIAPELYLKRLLVGGMERIFEIGKNFRNEGIDKTHNPEFTMLELYEAYGDSDSMQYVTRKICDSIGLESIANAEVREYADLIHEYAGVILFSKVGSEMYWSVGVEQHLASIASPLTPETPIDVLLDAVFDLAVLPNLKEPTFVVGYPSVLCPLAKPVARSWNNLICERWELFVGKMEIANAYTELNDPDLQRRNFEVQLGLLPGVFDPRIDYEFLDALLVGMPPAGGLGIGIDRLAMLLTGTDAIRDVITFPLVRGSKNTGGSPDSIGSSVEPNRSTV